MVVVLRLVYADSIDESPFVAASIDACWPLGGAFLQVLVGEVKLMACGCCGEVFRVRDSVLFVECLDFLDLEANSLWVRVV